MTAAQRRRIPMLIGAGLLLLQLGWILSITPFWGIDEFDHAYRASSVADGHWKAGDDPLRGGERGRGDLIPVRADVARAAHAACSARHYTGTLNCNPASDAGGGEVRIASAAGRYNPAYYAVVGTAAKPFSGAGFLYALRIAGALLCTGLVVLALRLALAGAETLWPLAATLVALLPTTVYSTTVAAPNGLEMVAGLGVWIALQVVVGGPRGTQRRGPAYALLALNAAVLANTHTLGPVWLALILGVTAVRHGPADTVRALLPRVRREWALATATLAAVAFQAVWIVTSGVNDPSLEGQSFQGHPLTYVVQGLVLWPLQAIGAYPMRDEHAPLVVYGLVLCLLLVLVGSAVRRAGLRSRQTAAMALVALLALAVPAYLTVKTFSHLGAAWQGRYASPFAVGLVVLAGLALDAGGRFPERARSVAAAAAGVLVLVELVSWWHVVDAERGVPGLLHASGWNPPPAALLVAIALGAAACWCAGVLAFTATHEPETLDADQELVIA